MDTYQEDKEQSGCHVNTISSNGKKLHNHLSKVVSPDLYMQVNAGIEWNQWEGLKGGTFFQFED